MSDGDEFKLLGLDDDSDFLSEIHKMQKIKVINAGRNA